MLSNKISLTEGSLYKNIFLFSLPLIASNLLQVLFNLADVAVVGKFAGAKALGSVGSTVILVSLFTGFLMGIGGGINVLVALQLGARNRARTQETIYTTFFAIAILGLLLLIIGICFGTPILRLLKTKDDLIDGAALYFRIYCLGMPALAIYNFGNAAYSAAGNTQKPLVFLSIAGVLNIILNLFFVIQCHMGVSGVAIASVISQYLSAVLITVSLMRNTGMIGFRWSEFKISPDILRDFIRVGLPAGLQYAIFAIANLFVQSGVNSFDTLMVEGNSAAANADNLVYDVMAAFYVACCSFIGQNRGAGKRKRILKSYFIAMFYSFFIAVIMDTALLIFSRQFLGLFTSESAVVDMGLKRLTIMCISYPVSAFMDCTIAASRGMGKTAAPTLMVILGSCVFRIVWIYTIFAYFKTIPSLYLLYIFSWAVTATFEIIYFAHIYRKYSG